MEVFSVPIDIEAKSDIITRIQNTKSCLWIVTVNPEILLEAKKNAAYRHALTQADVRMVDGFGLAMMMRLYGKTVQRWPGIDMAKEVLTTAKEKNWRVAFLGGENNIVTQAKNQIESELNLSIYAEQGGKVDKLGDDDEAGEEARHRLTLFDPEVLLVAFGHPKQEMWIAKHAQEFPNLKVIIGIGGSFDIWGKKLKRAPKWMRLIGLEWVWRLVQQPSRIGRIVNAVIVFPVLFITDRWKAKKSENKKSKLENDIKERLR